jgi:hypothetical protein
LEKKQNKYQNVRKDLYGDRLERNVSRRDSKEAKDKVKGKPEDREKVLLEFQQKRIIQ